MASFRDLKFLAGFITNRNKRPVNNFDVELVAKEIIEVRSEVEKRVEELNTSISENSGGMSANKIMAYSEL